jgi:hypothetical protein
MSSTIGNSDLLFRLVAMPTRFQLSGWQINFIESGPDIDPHDDEDDGAILKAERPALTANAFI